MSNQLKDLRLSFIQTHLEWENKAVNFKNLEIEIEAIETTDLIVLPEMFSTGFSMHSDQLAEKMDGPSIAWMGKMAEKKNAVVCGSLIIKENGSNFNRLIWMTPQGDYLHYDKRHLFRMANEHQHYSPGEERIITEIKGWKICPLICYDLRFPIWSRNVLKDKVYDYDLLIYIANWPAARSDAWQKLLYARAIENQSYVLGVNRIGDDQNGISYSGNSLLIDAKGKALVDLKNSAQTCTHSINYQDLSDFRLKFPLGLDADDFQIKTG